MKNLLILFFRFAPPADNYCFPSYYPDRCWSLMQWFENLLSVLKTDVAVFILKGVVIIVWLFDRAAVFVFNASLPNNEWLMNIRTQMLNLFSGMMPSLLRESAFGANGLMYVALSLAGLLMIIPMWGAGARFVRAEKVMLWGVVLSVFFVAGSFGYDFIGAIEGFRQNLVSRVALGSALPVDKLILQPMLAGEGDLGFGSDLTALPSVFDSTFFPSPRTMEITISEGGALSFGNVNVELPSDLEQRWSVAWTGVFYALISAMGGWLLLVAGFAYIALSFAALILIVFLFAALPLGFFETGETVLSGIIARYFQIIVQSLGLSFFLRWMSSGLGFITEVNSITNALIWAVVLSVMILIAHVFLDGAVRVLKDSGKSLQSAFTAASATFGGPSVVGETVKRAGGMAGGGQTQSAGLLSSLSALSAPVSAAALALGRPDVAMAANVIGGVTAQRQSQSGNSAAAPAPFQAGNVFVNNGNGSTADPQRQQPASSLPPPQQQQNQQPQTSTTTTDPLRAASAFYATAARNQWDETQMSYVRSVAQSAPSVETAVGQIQKAPGFERASSSDLHRAVQAAREMPSSSSAVRRKNNNG